MANVCVTATTGTAEREAALLLLAEAADAATVGGDKGFDVPSFVAGVRALGVTPHIAQKVTGSAIDDRTARHPGYAISQQKRKLIEQVFGWLKTVGELRKLRLSHRTSALWPTSSEPLPSSTGGSDGCPPLSLSSLLARADAGGVK